MNRTTLLDNYFNELCPDYQIKHWTSTDGALSEAVELFLNDSSNTDPDQHGRYLAEAIYLDSLKQGAVEEGIERYIKRYVAQKFGNDNAKVNAINRLCRDARTNRGSTNSNLLTELIAAAPANNLKPELPLQSMKDVREPTRFGDIVFLPKDAEVIVIGDTHGDLASTRHIISEIKSSGALDRGAYVVFLGDYTNNGVKSWQNLAEILSFQKSHPGSVVLLSGNHEFKESYLTALNEYLNIHWERFTAAELPNNLQDRLPQQDNHYDHLRLDLIRSFGIEEGERVYSLCAEWGLSLPYICISGHLMISHSLGKQAKCELRLPELLYGKQHDLDSIKRLGSEVCNARRASQHSALINSREMSPALLTEFANVLDVDQFVVGHCHYRSGDSLRFGNNSVTTVVSSRPFSPDSGHYMYQQMMVERGIKRKAENLGPADAFPCYLLFAATEHGKRKMSVSNLS